MDRLPRKLPPLLKNCNLLSLMKRDAKLTPIGRTISSEFGTKNCAEGVRIPGIAVGTANHASQRARIAKTRGPQDFDGNCIRRQAVHDERFARGARKESMKQRARRGCILRHPGTEMVGERTLAAKRVALELAAAPNAHRV